MATKKKTATAKIDRVKLIDELGELDLALETAKEWKSRRDAIHTLLRIEARAYPKSAGVTWDGIRFSVQLGKNATERTVTDKKRVQAVLGDALFFALVTVPLGKLEEYYPNAEADGVIKSDQTGERSVKTYIRGAQ
jgi:hypothetical protein